MHELAQGNAREFYASLRTCLTQGLVIAPRGLKIRELEDHTIDVSPVFPFMTFKERKYDVGYFKKEMLWKLGGDRFDDSIKQHAKMWESVQNSDGSFNSNYGQYWFHDDQRGFSHVVSELARDADSRQAVIPMLNWGHMGAEVKDKVCTFGVGFRIRDNRLNMSVQMRSSDQIFGLGTDIPTFSFLYRMALAALRYAYPDLMVGRLRITAMSSHIYERHFEMVERILSGPMEDYMPIQMPFAMDINEVNFLINSKGKYTEAPAEYKLANWLIAKV